MCDYSVLDILEECLDDCPWRVFLFLRALAQAPVDVTHEGPTCAAHFHQQYLRPLSCYNTRIKNMHPGSAIWLNIAIKLLYRRYLQNNYNCATINAIINCSAISCWLLVYEGVLYPTIHVLYIIMWVSIKGLTSFDSIYTVITPDVWCTCNAQCTSVKNLYYTRRM